MGTEISFSTNLELLNLFCYVFYNWFLILSVVNLITEKIYIIENKKNWYFPNLWNSIVVLKEWQSHLKDD